jgi:hypothetical protein
LRHRQVIGYRAAAPQQDRSVAVSAELVMGKGSSRSPGTPACFEALAVLLDRLGESALADQSGTEFRADLDQVEPLLQPFAMQTNRGRVAGLLRGDVLLRIRGISAALRPAALRNISPKAAIPA